MTLVAEQVGMGVKTVGCAAGDRADERNNLKHEFLRNWFG